VVSVREVSDGFSSSTFSFLISITNSHQNPNQPQTHIAHSLPLQNAGTVQAEETASGEDDEGEGALTFSASDFSAEDAVATSDDAVATKKKTSTSAARGRRRREDDAARGIYLSLSLSILHVLKRNEKGFRGQIGARKFDRFVASFARFRRK